MVTVVIVDCSVELKMKNSTPGVWSFFLGVCVPRTQRAIRRKVVQAGNKDHKIKMKKE